MNAGKRLDDTNRTGDCREDNIKAVVEGGCIRERYLDSTAPA
jgi:hypothetical protein